MDVPTLSGVHHVKLPVSDLARSLAWYESRLGYAKGTEFVDDGRLMGLYLRHPRGGPDLALRLDADRARRTAGFEYFVIGVPDRTSLDALAARLTGLGERHHGVIRAASGWMLPMLHDPDGHEVRFYTDEAHTDPADLDRVVDARANAQRA